MYVSVTLMVLTLSLQRPCHAQEHSLSRGFLKSRKSEVYIARIRCLVILMEGQGRVLRSVSIFSQPFPSLAMRTIIGGLQLSIHPSLYCPATHYSLLAPAILEWCKANLTHGHESWVQCLNRYATIRELTHIAILSTVRHIVLAYFKRDWYFTIWQ